MIRVLHMIGSLNIGGSQTMIMNLYRNIDREQIQFDFILDHPDQLFFAEEVKSLGGKIYFMPEFTGTNLLGVIKAWHRFFREHPEYKILHSHVRSYASVYLPIARRYGVKTIIHSHSTSNGRGLSSIVKALMQYPLRFEANYFFGCSFEAGKWLFGDRVVNSEKYYMLQNAIDLNKYLLTENIRTEYRNRIGVSDATTVFIHVGRFHAAKNHLFLLDVFSGYVKKNANSMLLLVGDGDLRSVIEKKVLELGITEHVKILGMRKDVPSWLNAADCFLFPSNWEGLPVTVVEAQAAGLPCLVSESVTKDVNVSELVTYLPIGGGIDPWIETMENMKYGKRDVSKEIIEAGFDIRTSAKWLSDFYVRIARYE